MLTSMMVMLSMQGLHYPLTYVSATGEVTVAMSDDEVETYGLGQNPRLNHETTKLVFWTQEDGANNGSIIEVNLETGSRSTLLTGPVRYPSYSKEGDLAYTKYEESGWHLAVWSANAKSEQILDTRDGVAPEWLPGESTVLWTTLLDYINVNLKGEEVWKRRKPFPEESPLTWNDRVVPHPYEPDTLLYSYTIWTPNGFLPVCGIQTLEQDLKVVTPPDMHATQGQWTRDGLSILFAGRSDSEEDPKIYKLNRDGTELTEIASGHSPSM